MPLRRHDDAIVAVSEKKPGVRVAKAAAQDRWLGCEYQHRKLAAPLTQFAVFPSSTCTVFDRLLRGRPCCKCNRNSQEVCRVWHNCGTLGSRFWWSANRQATQLARTSCRANHTQPVSLGRQLKLSSVTHLSESALTLTTSSFRLVLRAARTT